MRNIAASVRARLMQKAKDRGISFQYACLLYMQEGFLARIEASAYAEKLILKGGLLLSLMQEPIGRTTKDMDFLGIGIPNDDRALAAIISTVVAVKREDGLEYSADRVILERIVEGADYHGVRFHVTCTGLEQSAQTSKSI
jgi:predicted nucleotidyltransferase component of viral defense system